MELAILGAGAVGSAVAELASEYGHRVTAWADSTSAALDPAGLQVDEVLARKASGEPLGSAAPGDTLTARYDVLVEATPTTLDDAEPGFGHAQAALERDRHVVLANKGPVAERYPDLRELEQHSDGRVLFEATVGGAIPACATVSDVGPARVNAVRGVLNGTANFVLSRMAAEGLGYDHVLAEAQDLGVAEADPSFDVEGTDAALKCVILANLLIESDCDDIHELRQQTVSLADADVEGIRDVPTSALDLASEDARTVRLVGEATRDGVRVAPRLVPLDHPLAVDGTRNVVEIETKHAGELAISGRGAGGPETATAVLSDVGRLDD